MKYVITITLIIIGFVPSYTFACDNAYINDAEKRIIERGYNVKQFIGYDCATKLWKDLLKINKSESDPVKQSSTNYRAVYFHKKNALLEIWVFYDMDSGKYIDMIILSDDET